MNVRTGHRDNFDDLMDIEQRLRGTLRPVVPPHDVLSRLQQRIHFPDASELRRHLGDWRTLWLAVVGTLSGALLLLTLARALFHITGRRSSG